MTVTREQFEKEFEAFKRDAATRIQTLEKERDQAREETQAKTADIASMASDLENKNREISILRKKLEGFDLIAKGIAQIKVEGGVSEERVRQIVRESSPAGGAEGVDVTESVPYLNLKVAKPWLTLDEGTLEGQITVLALKEKLPARFGFGEVTKAIEKEYSWKVAGGSQRKRLQAALDVLVGKYKALERKVEGNQLVYSLRPDARSRVKESETHEPVQLKEAE